MPLHKLATLIKLPGDVWWRVLKLLIFTEGGQKVGAIADALVDPGRFRYLVIDIDTGFETSGENIATRWSFPHN